MWQREPRGSQQSVPDSCCSPEVSVVSICLPANCGTLMAPTNLVTVTSELFATAIRTLWIVLWLMNLFGAIEHVDRFGP